MWDDKQRQFAGMVLNTIETYCPALIAEEEHSYYLKHYQRRSVALDVLTNLKRLGWQKSIEHRFCDPCPTERLRLGIGEDLPYVGSSPCTDLELIQLIQTPREAHLHEIGHRWPVREDFWIEQIGSDLYEEVIFICGALHRITFKQKLETRGVKVAIVAKRVGHSRGTVASELPSVEFSAYKEVVRNGFPPKIGCPCVKTPDPTQAAPL